MRTKVRDIILPALGVIGMVVWIAGLAFMVTHEPVYVYTQGQPQPVPQQIAMGQSNEGK